MTETSFKSRGNNSYTFNSLNHLSNVYNRTFVGKKFTHLCFKHARFAKSFNDSVVFVSSMFNNIELT